MKLLFLCTSLEPCRDGVGDYARLLAQACIDAGHTCRLVALNDSFLQQSREEIQCDRAHEIDCLRLAASEPWPERIAAACACADRFQPDWVSWQIVPYGFHPKGVIPEEALGLNRLCAGRHVHVMMHELWIGLSTGERFRNRFWGRLQRRAAKAFIASLSPEILHTSNTAYKTVLARDGWPAEILPIFGNIPVAKVAPVASDTGKWAGGIFGTVHPQFEPLRCFDALAEGAKASQRTLRILGIGRLGTYGDALFAEMAKHYRDRVEFVAVGEKAPEDVSRLLQQLDFGIATHPWALAGKSGAVAAMLDHGLPVVVPRDDWTLRGQPVSIPAIDPLMIKHSEMPPELMAGRLAHRRAPSARLPAIAAQFLASLGAVPVKPVSKK